MRRQDTVRRVSARGVMQPVVAGISSLREKSIVVTSFVVTQICADRTDVLRNARPVVNSSDQKIVDISTSSGF